MCNTLFKKHLLMFLFYIKIKVIWIVLCAFIEYYHNMYLTKLRNTRHVNLMLIHVMLINVHIVTVEVFFRLNTQTA